MTFSGTKHHDAAGVRLDLAGELDDVDVQQLWPMILEAIVVDLPDLLLIDLDAVSYLSAGGLHALTAGYATAIAYGTSYRVVNAHGQVHHAMQASAVLDPLTDSDDVGALLLALLTLPPRST